MNQILSVVTEVKQFRAFYIFKYVFYWKSTLEKVLPNQTFLREGIPTQWPNQFVSDSISRLYVLVCTPWPGGGGGGWMHSGMPGGMHRELKTH
jgi:hypothetical protein